MLMLSVPPPGAAAPGLVTLAFRPPLQDGDEAAYLAGLARIGALPSRFALLVVLGAGMHLSPAGERAQALWFKASRQHIDQACVAMAVVRPVVTPKMVATFSRLWSMPVHFTTDEAAALAWLRRRLDTAA